MRFSSHPISDEITMLGYMSLIFVKCTTVMVAVLMVKLVSKYDPRRSSIDHMAPHRLDQNHHIPIQIIPSSQKRIPYHLESKA
jgi:hypothetical protein